MGLLRDGINIKVLLMEVCKINGR
ncbi:hypothetical protein MIDIC_20041 [Alphaproteobacteria bacterium]